MIREAIQLVVRGEDLPLELATGVMSEMMSAQATPSQIGSFITAMRMKGETETELRGFVTAMRDCCSKISSPPGAVDLCGTGGDGQNTFNVSTAASFVASAAGVPVAKHGNRSVSSRSGSADILAALGAPLDLPPDMAERSLSSVGFCFMFAPVFHRSMMNVLAPRREIGIRTFFNILGPMTNPAGVKHQLIGVYDPSLAPTMARVLSSLGTSRAMIVHGEGMDEITNLGRTKIVELSDGSIREYEISPCDFGLDLAEAGEMRGGAPVDNARTLLSIFRGERSHRTDIVAFNAAAALYISRKAESIDEGLRMSFEALRSGRAMERLQRYVELTLDMEAERQRTMEPSQLLERRILPEILRSRCEGISSELLRGIGRDGEGQQYLEMLDEALLRAPNVLTVLALNRARSLLDKPSLQSVPVNHTPISLSDAIRGSEGVAVIGEYKPSSPSARGISVPPAPELVVDLYSSSGVAGISVLVEEMFFGGGPELFSKIRERSPLPMLFKDFVLHERQLDLARALGADAVLLIAKMLSRRALARLACGCAARGMEPLIELHDAHDAEKLEAAGCRDRGRLVGVNCRDLETLELRPELFSSMRGMLPDDNVKVAESGVRSLSDLSHVHGYDAILVGSMLMRADDIGRTLTELVRACREVAR